MPPKTPEIVRPPSTPFILEFSASGDGNLRKATFNGAATLLKKKFPKALGAEKAGDVCRRKWTALKAAYHAVVDIKNMSGFTQSDNQGALLSFCLDTSLSQSHSS
ncbi:hypothetical protein PAXRUDRAFT_16813 [Paxillus rubicundulus Ve08.2h10]|uniref:Myb/SANT-like domain-containing protein n=1 Tax=Paxillus rubicundulus Ve08.2h10 TaxID=930991 RepID=A0A0D0C5Z1_9AGAM|nr:hypothetical protein PAXRUDRAFT_16813 [Paxillus rubicundulus Ve08.2h10]